MKYLTTENWLELDPVIAGSVFVSLSMTDGRSSPVTAADWAQNLLVPSLVPAVPSEVRELYEVARGAMLYGSLFYPLFTLGLEQIARVAEAAVMAKATLLGVPLQTAKGKRKNLYTILNDFLAGGTLTKAEYEDWSMIRKFRNDVSHSGQPMILPPGVALGLLGSLTETINRLFA